MSLKIMIADDEPTSLKAIRSLAVSSGHTVVTCDDPADAAERAQQKRFDVVFLGMRLPELAGLESARQVRNSQANRDTAIIMLNATDDIESLRLAFAEGADFVLTKPVSASRLLPLLAAMDSPGWNGKRHAARLPLFTDVRCVWGEQELFLRSLNISESGLLLQSSTEIEMEQEITLDFDIADVQASLTVRARVARKEGTDRVAVAFMDLAPEASNAIQLYVMGRLSKSQLSNEAGGRRNTWLSHGSLGES